MRRAPVLASGGEQMRTHCVWLAYCALAVPVTG